MVFYFSDCIVCSGLSRICTVFNVMKCGRVPVSKLLFVLHTLKILVTRDEMYCALQLMNVDGMWSRGFCVVSSYLMHSACYLWKADMKLEDYVEVNVCINFNLSDFALCNDDRANGSPSSCILRSLNKLHLGEKKII